MNSKIAKKNRPLEVAPASASGGESTADVPYRYTNFKGLMGLAVSVEHGGKRQPGKIMGARTNKGGDLELRVLLCSGQLLAVGLDDVTVAKAVDVVHAVHRRFNPELLTPREEEAADQALPVTEVDGPGCGGGGGGGDCVTFVNGNRRVTLSHPKFFEVGAVFMFDAAGDLQLVDPKKAFSRSRDEKHKADAEAWRSGDLPDLDADLRR